MKRSYGLMGLIFTACGPTAEPELTTDLDAIYRGAPANADHHAAVVALHDRYGNRVSAYPFCTGTLIAPDVVLTAAHCLDTASSGRTFRTMAPSALAIYFGPGLIDDPEPVLVPVTATRIFSGYDRRSTRNDIALVRLGATIPEAVAVPIAPLPAALGLRSSDVGVALEFVGFGDTETGDFGDRLTTNGTLGALGCRVSGCPGSGDTNTQLSYRQRTGGPCSGDSGGPAFITRDGTRYVAGVTSYGDGACLVYGVSTRADAFASFISGF